MLPKLEQPLLDEVGLGQHHKYTMPLLAAFLEVLCKRNYRGQRGQRLASADG